MTSASAQSLAHSLEKLKITGSAKAPVRPKKAEPADSWEEEAEDDDDIDRLAIPPSTSELTSPVGEYPCPPPTPALPSIKTAATSTGSPYQTFPPFGMNGSFEALGSNKPSSSVRQTDTMGEERRPEKTTATAARLIAAGIGQKAPRRTKEQREYDQAVRVQEKKKRDAAKEEEERKKREKEQALKDVWGD